ncbi:hypothetical protein HPB49_015349 [Dermacentor silvarum]|uniref:Uncharacterized protein n=1 Tax=Dermacentor silvarum TaxID=543639 RepID=A0ACB8E1I1_DERSI|nr:hypothetical protein HPB49_015349 [Dermacentor silvarum]
MRTVQALAWCRWSTAVHLLCEKAMHFERSEVAAVVVSTLRCSLRLHCAGGCRHNLKYCTAFLQDGRRKRLARNEVPVSLTSRTLPNDQELYLHTFDIAETGRLDAGLENSGTITEIESKNACGVTMRSSVLNTMNSVVISTCALSNYSMEKLSACQTNVSITKPRKTPGKQHCTHKIPDKQTTPLGRNGGDRFIPNHQKYAFCIDQRVFPKSKNIHVNQENAEYRAAIEEQLNFNLANFRIMANISGKLQHLVKPWGQQRSLQCLKTNSEERKLHLYRRRSSAYWTALTSGMTST